MIIKRNYKGLDLSIELTTEELNNAYLERKNELDCQEVKDHLFQKDIGEIIDMCEFPYPSRLYMLQEDVEKAEEKLCEDKKLLSNIYDKFMDLDIMEKSTHGDCMGWACKKELLSDIYDKFMNFDVMKKGAYGDCMDWACKEKLQKYGKEYPEFLNQFKGIATIAYEKYKKAWAKERNYSPEFLAKIHAEYEEVVRELQEPVCFEEYIDENGFAGECYVCFDEFLETEYQDMEYMKKLLSEEEFQMYLKKVAYEEFSETKEKSSVIRYTGEIIDLKDCDRIVAIMVINGKMYLSNCDHQDCYEEYCNEHGIASGLNWNDVEHFDEIHKQAVEITNELFQDETKAVYGFDIFEGYDDQYYLTSHFPSNMEKCYEMMLQYAKENGYKLGTFFDSTYKIKMIEMTGPLLSHFSEEDTIQVPF